jgi:hypothetical protein
MKPVARLPPVTPWTCQVTAVFVEPETMAENCCVPKLGMLGVPGETRIVMVKGCAEMVSMAGADLVRSRWEVASTVTCGGVGTVAGGVYRPVAETVVETFDDGGVQLERGTEDNICGAGLNGDGDDAARGAAFAGGKGYGEK